MTSSKPLSALLLLFALGAAMAQRLPNEGRVGKLFSLRYPDDWTFHPSSNGGTLFSQVRRDSGIGQNGLSLPIHYSKSLYSVADEREVLRAITGTMLAFLERKLSHSSRPIGRSGGWSHTWEIRNFFSNDSLGIVRVYAIPLSGTGSALMSAFLPVGYPREWDRDMDDIASSIARVQEKPAEKSEAQDPGAEPPSRTPAAPAPSAPATPPPPPAPLTPAQTQALVADWTKRLAGKEWQAARRTYKLRADGSCDYEWQSSIAGLDDAPRKRTASGTWKVVVTDGVPNLSLRLDQQVMALPCAERNAAITIDGDEVAAAAAR